jgi:hypothetical protein
MNDSAYAPSKWGAEFHNLPHHEALGAGSAGPGKSLVLLMDPLQQIQVEHHRCTLPRDHADYHPWGSSLGWALHLRRTFKMLDQTLARAKRMFPVIDPGVRFETDGMKFIFSSGYVYQFGHCHHAGEWDQYMSNEYTHIAFDELVQFTEEQYRQIKTRLRSSDRILRSMLKTRAMSNPVMRRETGESFHVDDPYWVRKYFVEPEPLGRVTIRNKLRRQNGEEFYRTRIYLPAKLSDNPDADFVRQYEEQLLEAPIHIRNALLNGDWWTVAGAHYSDHWVPQLHICRPFKIPSDWPRFRSMDWGFRAHGCIHWWAVDPDEDIMYCERELTFRKKSAKQVANIVRDIERGMDLWSTAYGDGGKSLITGPADTQLWESRGESSGRSKADEMGDEGVTWVKADKARRQRNSERFSERLDAHENYTVSPGIVFFDTCKKAITTIPGILTDPHNSECPADGGEDHWHDSVLYACSYESWQRGSLPKDDEDGPDEDIEQASAQGSWGYGT